MPKKFRAIAKLAAANERFRSSEKKDKFKALQEKVIERKKSVLSGPDKKPDLNSKYEEEAKMEKDMQLLYNARYEMSDEDLDEASSGLEDILDQNGSSTEEPVSESEDEQVKPKEEPKNVGNESDETCSLPSDVEAMLAEQRQNQGQNDNEEDDDDEEDDGDDEVSEKSDFELDNIIPSDDGGDSEDSEEKDQIDNKESDDGVNYSALEEEDDEEDSDAFTFTGHTETPTNGRDSRSSFKSTITKITENEESKEEKKTESVVLEEDETGKDEEAKAESITAAEQQALESEVESFPDITYSRSVSDIEEYESDVFNLDKDLDKLRRYANSYGGNSNDSDGDFSIPRAKESRFESQNDNEDATNMSDVAESIEDDSKSVKEEALNEEEEVHNNSTGEVNNENEENLSEHSDKKQECYILNENKNDEDSNEPNIEKEEGQKDGENKHIPTNDEDDTIIEDKETIPNEDDNKKYEGSSLSDEDTNPVERITIHDVTTYQKTRKKEKKMFKRKERMELFKRAHKTSFGKKKRNQQTLPPDSSIPSYKAKLAEIESQKRDENVSLLIGELLEGVHKEAVRRNKKRKAMAAAKSILDDVMDMWEGQVDTIDMIREEKVLENLSTCMVMATMIVAARDVAGEEPYIKMLHKEPKLKKTKQEENSRRKKKTRLLSKKEREELREKRRKTSGAKMAVTEEDSEIPDSRKSKQNSVDHEENKQLTETQIDESSRLEKELFNDNEKEKKREDFCDKQNFSSVSKEEHAKNYHVVNEEELDYIHGDDSISIGKSTVATVKRGEGERQIKYEEEVDEELADVLSLGSRSIPCKDKGGLITKEFPRIKLQQMENNEANDSESILTTLPKADKNDFCFQWVMNSTKVPSPPLHSQKNHNRVRDGRKKRFSRRLNRTDERPTSSTSIEEYHKTIDMDAVFNRALKSPGTESGASLAQSGRDSKLSVYSELSITTLKEEPVKVKEESLDKSVEDNIIEYFNGITREKIEGRNEGMQKEQNEERTEQQKNDNKQDNESIETKSDESEKDVNEEQASENGSVKSEESLLASDSTFVEEDPNERFPTPESEPEPEPEPELEPEPDPVEEIKETPRKKPPPSWTFSTTTLIRWRCFKPVIKEGARLSDYNSTMIKLRRSRFKDLSLSKPRSLSDLHKPVKIENIQVAREEKSPSRRRSTTKSNSPRLVLPPISLQNALVKSYQTRIKASSFSSEENICLPDIKAHAPRRRMAQGKVRGAWY
ncbi:uncharacterized protein LOC135685425 [Rhopilema esculentum]|uniref:uncharacterized protein LOC135685425 n=1 Tax=Rhopilema esculentum TaxID=499914 RepID=UPI0031D3D55B|eukprot:gene17260-8823_t